MGRGRTWRLLEHGPCGAAWNMAVDEAMLDAVEASLAPPTLRLYRWDSPAVSVGRFQDVARGLDLDACRRLGVEVVRRPTGGRGVLHGGDQTLSVAVPLQQLGPTTQSVITSYRALSRGLLHGLSSLGVYAASGACERRAVRAYGDCFAVRSRADVVTEDGRKLVGSAQYRRGGAILQQSSVRHVPRPVAAADLFLGPCGDETYPLAEVSSQELCDALVAGFEDALAVTLEPGDLSAWETERAAALAARQKPLTLIDSRSGL